MAVERAPSPPLGEVLATVGEGDFVELLDVEDASVRIGGCRQVASYNWLNGQKPAILVPGKRERTGSS